MSAHHAQRNKSVWLQSLLARTSKASRPSQLLSSCTTARRRERSGPRGRGSHEDGSAADTVRHGCGSLPGSGPSLSESPSLRERGCCGTHVVMLALVAAAGRTFRALSGIASLSML